MTSCARHSAPRSSARPARRVAALALVLSAGCGLFDADRFHFWRHDPLSDTYLSALGSWSREAQVPEELTLRLGLSAVWMSSEFRAALDTESRRLLNLPPEAASPILPAPVTGGVDLVVAVAGPSEKELALEAKQPFWNLLLIDPQGGRWKPARIARIDDRSPDRRLFPFHDNWSRLYLVSFPAEVARAAGSGKLTLEATGVYGRTSVDWKV